MQGCHAVYAEAVVDVDMRHMDGIVPVDDGCAFIVEFSSYSVVQHLDDRHKLGYDLLKIGDGPFLKSLRKNRMVGIGAGSGYHVDGCVHIQAAGSEQADQLRYYHGRVRVVDLDHRVVREIIELASPGHALIQDELSAAADHEILLVNAQKPPLFVAVVRIEEESQVLFNVFLIKIDSVRCNGIIHGIQIKKVKPVGPVMVACHFDIVHSRSDLQAAEFHGIGHVSPVQPGLIFDPGVRRLLLEVILKYLLKKSQMIVQSDSVSGQAQRSDGIQEAGGQTSQSAVSQRGFRLKLFNLAQILSVILQNLLYFSINPEVNQIVGEQLSDQKFRRNVINFLFSIHPFSACRHFLNKGQECGIEFSVFSLRDRLSKGMFQFLLNIHGKSPFKMYTNFLCSILVRDSLNFLQNTVLLLYNTII